MCDCVCVRTHHVLFPFVSITQVLFIADEVQTGLARTGKYVLYIANTSTHTYVHTSSPTQTVKHCGYRMCTVDSVAWSVSMVGHVFYMYVATVLTPNVMLQ